MTMPHRLSDIYDKFAVACVDRFAKEREHTVKLDAFRTVESLAKGAVLGSPGAGESSVLARMALGEVAPDSTTSSQPSSPGLAPSSSSSSSGRYAGASTIAARGGVVPATEAERKLLELMPILLAALTKHILHSRNAQEQQAAFGLLKTLSGLLPTVLEEHLALFEKPLLKGVRGAEDPLSCYALIILKNLLGCYKRCAVYQGLAAEVFPHLLTICRSSPNFRLVSEALKALAVTVHVVRDLRDGMGEGNEVADEIISKNGSTLFEVLFEKLLKTDLDQDVKESSLEALGHCVHCLGDLFPMQVGQCLGAPFLERLKNELTRAMAIRSLKVICQSPHAIALSDDQLHVVAQNLTSYLQQNQRILRQESLACLGLVLKKYGATLKEETQKLCVFATAPFFSDADLYLTDLAVQVLIHAVAQGKVSVEISEVIAQRCLPGILTCCRSPLLQGRL